MPIRSALRQTLGTLALVDTQLAFDCYLPLVFAGVWGAAAPQQGCLGGGSPPESGRGLGGDSPQGGRKNIYFVSWPKAMYLYPILAYSLDPGKPGCFMGPGHTRVTVISGS